MKVEKPLWMQKKELDDAELVKTGGHGRGDGPEMPKSHGAVYGPTESNVDQVGDGMIDVNHIMARFEKTGKLEELIAAGATFDGGGQYGDFTDMPTYEEALKISIRAKTQFELLSAPVRNRFNNNPGLFLAFVSDPKNSDECIAMGLKKRPEPQKPPETTLKDVVETLKAGQGSKKQAGKGGEDANG